MFIHCADGIPKTFVVGALFFSGNQSVVKRIAFYVVLEMFSLNWLVVFMCRPVLLEQFHNVHMQLQTLLTHFELYNSPIGIDMVHQQR